MPDELRPTADQILAGQAVYTPWRLRAYNAVVLGFSNRWVWRCPTAKLLALYDRHVKGNHFEVGVGTGYFLDRCRWPCDRPRLVLADLNEHCLKATQRRVARYAPQVLSHDVFQPLPGGLQPITSIGLNYVLHCLPGRMADKRRVIDHLRAVLAPQGVLFGSTILGSGGLHSWPAQRLMAFYNRRRIFSNTADSLPELEAALSAGLDVVQLDVIGSVARFAARAR
uniref:Methyltransferase domain-containing protein n=1 Tax=Schlesneria paludicola TaxID=360056 RepID=A0A7C2P9H6_9PLAN